MGVKQFTSYPSNLECDALYFFSLSFAGVSLQHLLDSLMFCCYPVLMIRTWVHGANYSFKGFLQVCVCVCVCVCERERETERESERERERTPNIFCEN